MCLDPIDSLGILKMLEPNSPLVPPIWSFPRLRWRRTMAGNDHDDGRAKLPIGRESVFVS
jgi:hypothetical protein